jgi:cytochrome c-type biogenesis protein CcmH/NrfG
MIEAMKKGSFLFLVIGFVVGFAGLYYWTKYREPQIVSATPLRITVPGSPGAGAAAQGPPPPPVDMAQVQQLQDRIKANPNDYDALVQLGNIHYDQRNYGDAEGLYKKALAIRGEDLDVRTDLGTMLFYLNKYDEAITELNKVLAKNPTHSQALFNMGVVQLHGKNNPQAALQAWEKLVETNPNFPEISVVKDQIQKLKSSK